MNEYKNYFHNPDLRNPGDSPCNKIRTTHNKIIHPDMTQKKKKKNIKGFNCVSYLFNNNIELDPIWPLHPAFKQKDNITGMYIEVHIK